MAELKGLVDNWILLARACLAQLVQAATRAYARRAVPRDPAATSGVGLAREPAPGVLGATLEAHDVLRGEWTVVVVGPHYAGALIARDLGDEGPDRDRRFAFTVTHRRDVVVAAALSLFERTEPQHRTRVQAADALDGPRLASPRAFVAPAREASLSATR